jgi:hypothetical protein
MTFSHCLFMTFSLQITFFFSSMHNLRVGNACFYFMYNLEVGNACLKTDLMKMYNLEIENVFLKK